MVRDRLQPEADQLTIVTWNVKRLIPMFFNIGAGSSNGRTADFESADRGSSPRPAIW